MEKYCFPYNISNCIYIGDNVFINITTSLENDEYLLRNQDKQIKYILICFFKFKYPISSIQKYNFPRSTSLYYHMTNLIYMFELRLIYFF